MTCGIFKRTTCLGDLEFGKGFHQVGWFAAFDDPDCMDSDNDLPCVCW